MKSRVGLGGGGNAVVGQVKWVRGDRVGAWAVRAWWAALPFIAGPVLADGLNGTSPAWRSTASVGLWVLWSVVLVASLITHPATLVVVRLALPSVVVALVWAGLGDADWEATILAASITVAAAAVALSAPVGQVFVNGASYGDEVRMLLRPPAVLMAGPLPLAAGLTVGGMVSGPLMLAAQWWVPGVIVTAVGGVLAVVGARSLYSLTRRWLVFVPAGVVLHDHLALRDPVLIRRSTVVGLAPALKDSEALDLSQGAAGLLMELKTNQPVTLSQAVGGRRKRRASNAGAKGHEAKATAVLFAPSRPGRVVVLFRQRLLGSMRR